MAGAGFKTFTTGEVLLAADVNTYLMQQTVMVFDDASARATAIPSPSEGMFSYLKDTNLTYRYDGSAWLSDAGATSPLTTKGDLWGYSTTDARIPVGANGTVLTADSAEASGLKWATPSSGFTIGVDTVATEESTTSGSFTDLATVGPTVTLTTGTKAWVIISARMKNSSAGEWPQMGVEVSGASSVSPNFGKLATFIEPTANYQWVITASFTYTGLTAGSNTFKAKYRTYTGGTSTFVDRYIQVIDLGS